MFPDLSDEEYNVTLTDRNDGNYRKEDPKNEIWKYYIKAATYLPLKYDDFNLLSCLEVSASTTVKKTHSSWLQQSHVCVTEFTV